MKILKEKLTSNQLKVIDIVKKHWELATFIHLDECDDNYKMFLFKIPKEYKCPDFLISAYNLIGDVYTDSNERFNYLFGADYNF